MTRMHIGYANVFVSDMPRAIDFFQDTLGLAVSVADSEHGYASLQAGPISLGLALTDDATLVGRHTGLGFIVDDIDAAYAELSDKGVEFEMAPTRQPWGGTLALFKDPDDNVYYLDPGHGG